MKKTVREKIADITELPKDFVMNMPRVIMLGNKELVVNNYKGILEYTDTLIRLSGNNKQIAILGEGLMINRLDIDSVSVGGNIDRIEFCPKNKKVFD